MKILHSVVLLGLAGTMVFARQVPDDPVLKARAQRALAMGISEGDLPPVPRTIAEPPPLPAPETNYKDTRKAGPLALPVPPMAGKDGTIPPRARSTGRRNPGKRIIADANRPAHIGR